MNAIKENPKYFYSYAKKFSKVKKVGPLNVSESGQLTSANVHMVELLAEQYNKMFSVPKQHIDPVTSKTNKKLNDVQFVEDDIIAAIDELPLDQMAFQQ